MDTTFDGSRRPGTRRTALLLLRTFLGIVYLSNGLAKVFSFHTVTLGPWKTFLINRQDALGIQRSNSGSAPGILHDLGNTVVDNWDVLQWLLTAGEVAVGLGLLLGVLSRFAAVGGLLLALGPLVFTLGASNTWTYDYLFEPVTLLALALAPSLPGLGSFLSRGSWQRSRSDPGAPASGAATVREISTAPESAAGPPSI